MRLHALSTTQTTRCGGTRVEALPSFVRSTPISDLRVRRRVVHGHGVPAFCGRLAAMIAVRAGILVAAVSAFSPRATLPRCVCLRRPVCAVMQQPEVNMTSAFATALAASPWLRQYAAERAAADLRNAPDARPVWDAHLRLYPQKRTGWARVERAAGLVSAYWELVFALNSSGRPPDPPEDASSPSFDSKGSCV